MRSRSTASTFCQVIVLFSLLLSACGASEVQPVASDADPTIIAPASAAAAVIATPVIDEGMAEVINRAIIAELEREHTEAAEGTIIAFVDEQSLGSTPSGAHAVWSYVLNGFKELPAARYQEALNADAWRRPPFIVSYAIVEQSPTRAVISVDIASSMGLKRGPVNFYHWTLEKTSAGWQLLSIELTGIGDVFDYVPSENLAPGQRRSLDLPASPER